jgi:hypothetical protein
MKKSRMFLASVVMLAASASASPTLADESGTSFWLLGSYAGQGAVPSTPGLSIDTTFYSAGASAGRTAAFARGGRIEVDLDTSSTYFMLTPTYAFETPVLGGQGATTVRRCRPPWWHPPAPACPARSAIR